MNPSQRIVLNTAATYARSLLAASLLLFSSRWVLGALGPSDYGLFAVVGSIMVFITFLNGVLAGSAARHFAFAIGQGDFNEVNKWFNASLGVHLILPVVLVLLGWPIGEYCVRHVLVIPLDRINSCIWVFRLSLILAFIGMVSTPYNAMFSAKQHIAELAVWSTFQSLLLFLFAYLLTKMTGDRMLFYAGYGVIIGVLFQVGIVIRAHHIFRECRYDPTYWFNRQRNSKIFSFAIWSLIGSFGYMVRTQGPAILLNLFFGAKVNAAYGIASSVSTQTVTLSNAMVGALSPEITANEGRGDRARMLDLALRACKFGTLLIMLFAIPLIIEMDYILKLWLREPPEYTTLFCQLMLAILIVDYITIGHMMAVNASGKIAAYQLTLGTLNVLSIPLAWLFLYLGFAPTSVGVALVIMCTLASLGRVLWARYLLQMSAWRWIANVVFPCAIVSTGGALIAIAPSLFMPPSFVRLLISASASVVISVILGWFIVLNSNERQFLIQNAVKVLGKVVDRGAKPC